MAVYTITKLRPEYNKEWEEMRIQREAAMTRAAELVISGKDRYKKIESLTGAPWYFIGILHLRESSCNFHTHLHNGDSLNGYTHHVPAGRPRVNHAPPFTFEESAVDALGLEGFLRQSDWSVSMMSYRFEKYNGWGYRAHGVPSAYLWAGTSIYKGGKFVSDGVFDASENDVQLGCMGVLKEIAKIEKIDVDKIKPPKYKQSEKLSPKAHINRPSNKEMNQTSRKHWWTELFQGFLAFLGVGTTTAGTLDINQVQATKSTLDFFKGFASEYGIWFVLGIIGAFFVYATYMKKLMKDDVQEGRAQPSGGEINKPLIEAPVVVTDVNVVNPVAPATGGSNEPKA